jgi:hypothetical protein
MSCHVLVLQPRENANIASIGKQRKNRGKELRGTAKVKGAKKKKSAD